MKTKYSCFKCESYEVIKVPGKKMSESDRISLSKWGTKKVIIDRYICVDCGYTEEYVRLTDSFKKWGRQVLDKQGGGGFDEFV